MTVTRRTFLKASGAAAASATVASVTSHFLLAPLLEELGAQAAEPEAGEKWIPSVCLQCPGACGILVRVVDGRAVKIEGNPNHPVNRGKICLKAQAGLQILYDPDRIKGPMKRVGERGSGQWESISWDVAIKTLADRMRDLRSGGKAHTVVSLSGRRQSQMTGVVENFMRSYGSPNHLRRGASCGVAGEKGYWMLDGVDKHKAHDWANARYIVSFGYALLEAGRPLTYSIGSLGRARRGGPVRGKLVMVDPRMGTTGAKADEWVPIKPGTDGAMALAMAHVILTDGLWDRPFVGDFKVPGLAFRKGERVLDESFQENQTVGLVKWWNEVLKDTTPEWQAAITGVPAAQVARIARELATTKPAVVDGGDKGTSSQSNGMYTRAAVHALNGLIGAIEAPGGILIAQRSVKEKALAAVVVDDIAKESLKQPRIDQAKSKKWPLAGNVYGYVPQAILDGYEVNVLLSYYTDPYYCWPDTNIFRKAFAKVPMLVSFSPFLDEYTANCDLILPDRTYLERYQDVPAAESVGYAVLALRRPVVKPLYDTMESSDVFIRLAKALGGSVQQTLPYATADAMTNDVLSELPSSDRAALERDGVIAKAPYKFRDYAATIKTPSKKFEFDSANLRAAFTGLKLTEGEIAKLGITARGDAVYLPHYEPIRYSGGPAADYPLVLNTFKPAARGEGRTSNVPFLSEVTSPFHPAKWDSWAEINPETADQFGIKDGDEVWVESTLGRIKTIARVYGGVAPDTVSIPAHFGHRGYGRWAKDRGVNPNDIIPQDYDYTCGQAAFLARVKIYREGSVS